MISEKKRLDSHLSPTPSFLLLHSPSALPAPHQTSLRPADNSSVIITSIKISFAVPSKQNQGSTSCLSSKMSQGCFSHLWSHSAAFPQYPCHKLVTWNHQSLRVLVADQVLGSSPSLSEPLSDCCLNIVQKWQHFVSATCSGKGCIELAVGDTNSASPDTNSEQQNLLPAS